MGLDPRLRLHWSRIMSSLGPRLDLACVPWEAIAISDSLI
jgi:hypothetical protein